MTEMRLYPTAFMLWLALVFVWFGLTVLRGQHKQFAWGALWTGLFVVAGLHVLNPDDFIVRHNVKLMEQERSFDTDYMVDNLSDDAIPALAEALPKMNSDDQCRVKNEFWRRWKTDQSNGDFRTWNLSRWQAQQIIMRLAWDCPIDNVIFKSAFPCIGLQKHDPREDLRCGWMI
jgi:hypothetical protein